MNEERGEPSFLGKSIPGEGTAGAKSLSLGRAWQVGGTAGSLVCLQWSQQEGGKSEVREINREQSMSEQWFSALFACLKGTNVPFLLQIFSYAHFTL